MQKYDVAVIGGGLIGCASAYYLSLSGSHVAVIERGQINQGASGQNAGSLHFQLEHRLIADKERIAKELESHVALTRLAIDHWRSIEQELDCDLEVVMDGGFMVAETSEEIKLLEEKSEIEKREGLTVELLSHEETRRLAPYLSNSIQASLFCPYEGHCNPRLLTPAYARGTQANGADIYTNSEVTAVQYRGAKWQIELSHSHRESISADVILNTAGAWAKELCAMVDIELPLFPVGLIMNVTERTAPFIPHLIQHAGRKLSMKQVRDGNVLIGGGWSAMLRQENGNWLSDTSPLIDTDNLLANLRTASDVIPQVQTLHLLRTWSGTTALTADQLPVLGEISKAPGFFIAAGGSGFTYGPTYGRLMSELILKGRTTFPIEPYSPARLNS